MQDLNDLFYFAKVVEHGGFAAAGRLLGIPKSRLSRRIAELETRLGARLLQRTTRKLSLTDAGEAYLLRVRNILHEVEDAESAAAEHTRELQGTLHVLATPVLASYYLSPRIATWHARNPKVLLDLAISISISLLMNWYNKRIALIER
eukprot:gene46968-57514_t